MRSSLYRRRGSFSDDDTEPLLPNRDEPRPSTSFRNEVLHFKLFLYHFFFLINYYLTIL